MDRSPFGERLYRARRARRMTQEELARKVGLSKRMVSRYEGSFGGPPMETLRKFADALNVTASYLLGESPLKKIKEEISPELKKYVDALQRLPRRDRKSILRMIELAERDAQERDEKE